MKITLSTLCLACLMKSTFLYDSRSCFNFDMYLLIRRKNLIKCWTKQAPGLRKNAFKRQFQKNGHKVFVWVREYVRESEWEIERERERADCTTQMRLKPRIYRLSLSLSLSLSDFLKYILDENKGFRYDQKFDLLHT